MMGSAGWAGLVAKEMVNWLKASSNSLEMHAASSAAAMPARDGSHEAVDEAEAATATGGPCCLFLGPFFRT